MVTSRHLVQSKKYFGHEFAPVCVSSLKEALEQTGAFIVITSSWREGRSLTQLQSIFELNGIHEVIGMTPIFEGRIRGYVVEEYIQNVKGTELEVQQFVILDDEEEMGNLKQFLIETEFQTGITNPIKDEIIKRLSN
ncbi:hypothetical protein J2T17_007653 [Paenibacillus mucilaginosus]|uniref:HAD domain-containing protein n=1 Tax=Paenibacillus mucilaginosus TaxID=61624 RepID=UPI003D20C21B